ncbi:uncharacterized protein BO80DRAFT_450150 [Aspergillus ibericus CBS 121593]|uniref:Uncharacterized protein n=1 Tax=Aspergillus ibericus CBS 121593 TaxID=1448316 RepID=A0A395GJ45_9EURO|nr:hypothetical protein BO80DRAFT_450150 [Aspergillus ibericus CBS 121593]RAK95501.1 hypothetical protein BO80DRAFT_450150 [Aspergillus ibericus CBS 121593]
MSSQYSDSESSVSSQTRSKTPYQTFPLAHPPPKFTPRLRFLPRLLLQIQQLSSTSHRVLPIHDIYQPPIQGKHLPKCPRKLHARDIYILQSDAYTDLPPAAQSGETTAIPKSENYPTTAGVIYFSSSSSSSSCKRQQNQQTQHQETNPTELSATGSTDEIFFPSTQQSYHVSKSPKGYKFTSTSAKDGTTTTTTTTTTTLEWRKRTPGGRRPVSAASGSTDSDANTNTSTTTANNGKACEEKGTGTAAEENPRFVFCINSGGKKWTGLAGLEKKGLRIGGWEGRQRRVLNEVVGLGLGEEEVYTVILTLGVYVGRAEGWL